MLELLKRVNKSGVPLKVSLDAPQAIPENCQIKANTDSQALESWLAECTNKNTFKSYQREGRRFLIWGVTVKGCNIRDLKKEDFKDYFDFLSNPPLKYRKIKIDYVENGERKYIIPFKAPLSGSTLGRAISSINAFMTYLVRADFLVNNPLSIMNSYKFNKTDVAYSTMARILELEEWQAIQVALSNLPENSSDEINFKFKAQFLFAMLYFLGLRIEEFAVHRWDAFIRRNDEWWFLVEGKGGKKSHLPVHLQLLSFIKSYRKNLGLPELPSGEYEHFIKSKKTREGISYSQLYSIVKKVANIALLGFDKKSQQRLRLEKFSPHWLRHLFASHLDRNGVAYQLIQRLLRHGAQDVTSIYVHETDQKLIEAVSQLSMDVKQIKGVQVKNTVISLSVKSLPNQELVFERFLKFIEAHVLSDYTISKGWCMERLVTEFEESSKMHSSVEVKYTLTKIFNKSEQLWLVDAIKQAADIRLLRVNAVVD